jgi:hypothetical protein
MPPKMPSDAADRSLPRESAPPKIKESSKSDIAKPLENRLEFLEKASTELNRLQQSRDAEFFYYIINTYPLNWHYNNNNKPTNLRVSPIFLQLL